MKWTPKIGDQLAYRVASVKDEVVVAEWFALNGAKKIRGPTQKGELSLPPFVVKRYKDNEKKDFRVGSTYYSDYIGDKELGEGKKFKQAITTEGADGPIEDAFDLSDHVVVNDLLPKTKEGKGGGSGSENKKIATPLPRPEPADPAGLWEDLSEFVDRYLWLPEPNDCLLLKLWIAWTYTKERATAAFHLLFSGRTESGKNQGLGIVYLTADTGYSSSSMKPAGLFRLVDAQPELTLILEEFSIPYNPDEDTKDVVELLLAMISRGKKVIRLEKSEGKYVPYEYSIFGGVAFSTKVIERLQEDLRNRCMVINTVKAPFENRKPLLAVVDTDETKGIRAKMLGMREAIFKDYPEVNAPDSFRRNYRYKDVYTVLAPVAQYFGNERELEQALLKQAEEYTTFKRESLVGDIVGALGKAYEMRKPEDKYPTLEQVFFHSPKETEGGGGKTKKVTKRLVGSVLRKIGCRLVEEKTETIAMTFVIIKDAFLHDLTEEYGHSAGPSGPSGPSIAVIHKTETEERKEDEREKVAITVKDGPYGPYGPAVKVLHGKPVGTKGEWLCPICGTTNAKRYYVCGKCGKGLSP